MKNRRVQVVDMNLVLDGVIPIVVGRAVFHASFDAAAGRAHRESVRVMVAAIRALGNRRASEFAAQGPKCRRAGRVPSGRGLSRRRLVHFGCIVRVIPFPLLVLGPLIAVRHLERTSPPHSAKRRAMRHWRPNKDVGLPGRPGRTISRGVGRFARRCPLQFRRRQLPCERPAQTNRSALPAQRSGPVRDSCSRLIVRRKSSSIR